ncbi:M67 family metallopeptidase [Sphingomonas sp. BT553]|uniref:M67 family metallopeptidase n=2 Tax=Sphingomonas mollis TaxID=2795726 RepID=A0ABS0XTR1_9SPHN|nr:M67 family metallopeptidase [Sphingomonas sp. BT553]MBJ6123150.1 M67 family metallopeptidase [Sphingomonas sp. BT553]
MDVAISSDLLQRIVAAAAADPAVEVCGLLFGEAGAIVAVEACRNVAGDPARRFEIDPAALIAAYRRGRSGGPAVIGCYHSHPTGIAAPSARDAGDAAADGGLWLIVGGGAVTAWRAVANGPVHGRFEPVRLVVATDRG